MSSLVTCVKCKKVPEKCIDIKFALYCSPCFQDATFHKYRSLLSRCNQQIDSDSTSTSASTSALILLPKNFFSDPKVFRAGRLLIHFSQLPGILEPARKNLVEYHLAVALDGDDSNREKVSAFLSQIKMEYPKLGEIFIIDPSNSEGDYYKCDQLSHQPNPKDLESITNSTLKEDYMNAVILHAALRLMKRLLVSKALCPDSSTALASYILCCTCKGRGKFLPWDSGLIRDFPDNLYLIRPMKEISDREMELYCNEANFSEILIKDNNSNNNNSAVLTSSLSIDQLTTNFTSSLEFENPGTANVVIRTSAKVSTSSRNDSAVRCRICFAPNDSNLCDSCVPISQYFN